MGRRPLASRRERELLARFFSRERLPALLLQGRVDADALVLGPVLGRGSFGTVHAGEWHVNPLASPRLVAVKALHRNQLTESRMPALLRALNLESSLCRHPNVIAMLGVAWSVDTARILIVSELCSSGSLDSALASGDTKSWSTPRKLSTALGVAEGLAYLHGLKPSVLHRDLKPENILFSEGGATGVPKLADLGEARHLGGFADEAALMTVGIGTPYFLAPEQLARSHYDLGVDIWAVGCVFTCLYSNRCSPYPPLSRQAGAGDGVLSRVMRGTLAPALPATCSMHGFVRDCCQYVPADRPTTASLASQLRAARDRSDCGLGPSQCKWV